MKSRPDDADSDTEKSRREIKRTSKRKKNLGGKVECMKKFITKKEIQEDEEDEEKYTCIVKTPIN